MPYIATKVGKCWRVINTQTAQVKARCSNEIDAQYQMRLLNSIDKKKPINFK